MKRATGVKTTKKMAPITTGLTILLRSSPKRIQATLSGASQCARVRVTTANTAPTAIIQGWERAPTMKKSAANVQPNLRSDGIRAVFMAGENSAPLRRAVRDQG